jgi:hypothetical protein
MENLALCCVLCNQHKGSDIASIDPVTDTIVPLYHPRRERWLDHFQLSGVQFISLTPTGRATARLLQLNHPNRIAERELLIASDIFRLPTV